MAQDVISTATTSRAMLKAMGESIERLSIFLPGDAVATMRLARSVMADLDKRIDRIEHALDLPNIM